MLLVHRTEFKGIPDQRIYYNRGNNKGTFNEGEVRFMNSSLEEIKIT